MAEPSTDQGQTTSVEPTEPRRGSTTWLLSVFVALAIYVLSIGPAMKVYDRYPSRQTAIDFLYIPLHFLDHHCPGAHAFLNWYIYQVWKA